MRLPKLARHLSRAGYDASSREADAVAYGVARCRSGKYTKDRSRQEYAGANDLTWTKYVHVIHLWFDFCVVQGMFLRRWQQMPMSQDMWADVARHFFHYSSERGLQMSTLEQYLRMLTHVLVFMTPLFGGGDSTHCIPPNLHTYSKWSVTLLRSILRPVANATRKKHGTTAWWMPVCSCCCCGVCMGIVNDSTRLGQPMLAWCCVCSISWAGALSVSHTGLAKLKAVHVGLVWLCWPLATAICSGGMMGLLV